MFPDTRSTPSETRVLMGSIHLRRSWTLLAWLGGILFCITALYSLFQMSRLGLLPGASAGELPSLVAYTKPYEPARALIPLTGVFVEPSIQQTFRENFALNTPDWSALQGKISFGDESLQLSANWLAEGGITTWNLPPSLVTPALIYSADLTSQAKAWQRFGLALNLQPDGSGLFFLIEPDTGKVAIAWHYSRGAAYLVPWQTSPGVLPAPSPNHIEINCSPEKILLRVNGLDAASVTPPLPCNQGQLGAFVLTPGAPISVDNATLALVQ